MAEKIPDFLERDVDLALSSSGTSLKGTCLKLPHLSYCYDAVTSDTGFRQALTVSPISGFERVTVSQVLLGADVVSTADFGAAAACRFVPGGASREFRHSG